MEIVALLHIFVPYLNAPTVRQMEHIITAILTMSGRVTMLGISRWTGKGRLYFVYRAFSQPPRQRLSAGVFIVVSSHIQKCR